MYIIKKTHALRTNLEHSFQLICELAATLRLKLKQALQLWIRKLL